jgi:PKD repeat protein
MRFSFRRNAIALVAVLCTLGFVGVVLAAPPVANFTIDDDTPLTGQLVTFTSTSTDAEEDIASIEWDFEYNGTSFEPDATGNSASHIYLTPGSRNVAIRVTDTDAVDGSADQVVLAKPVSVALNSAPTAVLSGPSSAGVGQTVTFSGSGSTDSDGVIVRYEWDLDNNGTYETDTGASANVSTSYATPGTRTIRLRVTDNLGATATDSAPFAVSNATPTASFTISPNPAAIGQTVNFNASASGDSDGTIVKYEWDLDGNGTFELDTGASDTTSRTYDTGGTRTIRLRVTDDDGASTVDTDTLFVNNAGPSASFTIAPNPAQIGETVTFDADASGDSDGSIVKYEWDLDGNGSYETDTGGTDTTTQSYATPGTRTIRLKVTDDDGAVATDADSLRINAKPTPSFTITPNPAVIDETVTFDAGTSADSDGTITQYQWDLDGNGTYDAPPSATPVASRSYATAGSRTIKLRVTDNNGATNELTRTLVVQLTRPNAGFSFTPQAPLPGQAIDLTSQSTPSSSPGNPVIESTQWDFNYDPTQDFTPDASGATATTSYPTAGVKTVAIKVTETGGGFAIASATIQVNAPPQASFNVAPGSPFDGDNVTLASTSSDPDGPLGTQEWDLDGDGQYDDAAGAIATRAFATGIRIVRLRVTDARGATATAERRIDVLERPLKLLTGVKVTLFGNLTSRGVRLKRLLVRTPGKANVRVTCKGKKCPKGARAASTRPAKTKRVRFKKFERAFPAGTLITVTVTRPGYIGQQTTIKIRKGLRRYIRRDSCLRPGSSKPIACPDS